MTRPSVLLAVTADQSLKLMNGFPGFLASAGWNVHLVSGGDTGRPFNHYVGDCAGVTTHVIAMRRDPSLVEDLKSLWKWLKLMGRVRPEVILVGTPKASLLAHLAARRHRVPVRIYLLRGLRLEGSRGPARAILGVMERVTAWNATEVIAVSKSLADRATSLRIGPGKTVVIGAGSSNGIKIPGASEVGNARERDLTALGLEHAMPTIGYVGRLTKDKGLHVLVEATTLMASTGVRAQLLFIGEEDEPGYLQELEQALAAGGVPYALTGYVSDPSRWVRVLDVFCLPSFREGMPNVALEASALGKPVVTTTATGCVDALVANETGLVVTPGDAADLSRALTVLVRQPELRQRLGKAGARWVAENFNREVVWKRYEQHLRGHLKG